MSTRVCVVTPAGRAAVAVVAVEGPLAVPAVDRFFQAANRRSVSDQPIGRIVYGHWDGGEDLVICRRADQSLEVHCHGGRQSSAQIVADLCEAGCEKVEPNEWLSRQHECPLSAAAHFAMTQATTYRAAAVLLDQYHGALRHELEAIAAALESGDADGAKAKVDQMLRWAELGRHLTEPWRVVIAGQPNVGKSSLINALVGFERAIVFDQPGTTRDVVSSMTAIDGWPVQLSDTAGLHETSDAIETAGIALARERLSAADLVVWVLDAVEVSRNDDEVWQLAEQQARAVGVSFDREQSLLVVNKIDKVEHAVDQPQAVATAAITGQGIEQLLDEIAARLVPQVPPSGAAVPFAPEQIVALQSAQSAVAAGDLAKAVQEVRRLLS